MVDTGKRDDQYYVHLDTVSPFSHSQKLSTPQMYRLCKDGHRCCLVKVFDVADFVRSLL